MKLILILTTICFFQASAASFAQRISLKEKNASLNDVINKIRKQSGYDFLADSKLLDQAKTVTVSLKSVSLEEALTACLADQNIGFTVKNKIVLLKPLFEKSKNNPPPFELNWIDVKGKVVDEQGLPIPGATVKVKETGKVAITNENGQFTIAGAGFGETLTITYVGFLSQEVKLPPSGVIEIILKAQNNNLNELVVVGYGTQKKANLTGATSTIKMDEVLGSRPVSGVASALQGAVPGLTISGGANPGATKNINIRGLTSINGGDPLILVDNVVTTNLDLLNPQDIESVSVLKDAASAAIYGARAAFGVVIITTKKGSKNQKTQFNYNNNFAVQKVIDIPQKASPIQTLQGYKDMGYTNYWSGQNVQKWYDLIMDYNSNPSKYPSGWVEDGGYRYFLRNNDEIKDMISNGTKQMHFISANGGSENMMYRFSFGSTGEDGVLITDKDSYKRRNVSSYINGNLTKWLSSSVDFKFAKGTRTNPHQAGELGLFATGHPSYYPKDSLAFNGTEYPVNTPVNIIKNSSPETWVNENTRVFSSTQVNPLPGLKGVFEYTYETNLLDNKYYNNLYWLQRGVENAIDPSDQSQTYYVNKFKTTYQSVNVYGSYEKKIHDAYNFKLIAGFNQELSNNDGLWAKNFYMVSNELPSISGGTGIIQAQDNLSDYALRGWFYRFNFNYKDRYLLEANGRYDGSSKFPANNRFGFFPSVSAGWNISNESFMNGFKEKINLLKVRVSYGALGNQAIDNYSFFSVMNPYKPNWIYNAQLPVSLSAPNLVRSDFTWEKVNTLDLGLDFTLFNFRLNGTFDWYRRNTIGMLAPGLDFPAVVGAKAPQQNAADLKTVGWEAGLQWQDKINDWNYSVGANVYDSRSTITKFRNDNKVLGNYYNGMQVGEIWGFVTDGFYTSDDFNSNGALKPEVVSIQGVLSHEGDLKYKNLRDGTNSTNQIDVGENTVNNPGDRKVIGNNTPRYNFGANASIGWKSIDLSIILQGVAKRDAWIGGELMFPHAGKFSTFYTSQLNYWTPNNKDAYFGRLYQDAGESTASNQRIQTRFLQNAAYLRVKNITLSYGLPKRLISKIHLNAVKIFVSGENIFTSTKLIPGVDPELLSWQYPQMSQYSFGINVNL